MASSLTKKLYFNYPGWDFEAGKNDPEVMEGVWILGISYGAAVGPGQILFWYATEFDAFG